MNERIIYLNGMSCSSCEKLIMRVAEMHRIEILQVNISQGFIKFFCDDSKLDSFKQALAEKGFTERTSDQAQVCITERGSYSRFFSFIKNVLSGGEGFEYESKLLNTALLTTIVLFLISGILLYFRFIQGAYLPLIMLTVFGVVALAYGYSHAKSYKSSIPCMNGMMSGMTLGMIGGFLGGLLIAATNGMFIGSVAGIIIGVALGFGTGRLCGVMGALEGMMGGFMSGIMGAMTSVMLFNDNLLIFLYICFGIGILILAGLSYMFYRENSSTNQQRTVHADIFFMTAFYIYAFLIAVMLYAPKGPLTFI